MLPANLARAERLGARGGAAGRADHLPEGAVQRALLLQVAAVRSLRPRRADSRARRPRRCRRLARELAVVIIVPIFERQAAGHLPELGGRHRRGRRPARHLPEDAHPGRSAVQREVLLHARRRHRLPRRAAGRGERLQGVEDALRDHRRADLLGPVVSRSRAHHRAARRAGALLSDRDRLAPAEKDEWGARRSTPGARSSARTPSPTASTSRRRIASATRTSRARTASSSSATRSSPIPFGRYIAEAGEDEEILIAQCDPALIETVRRNWPFLRDRRIDAYGPILNRYLGRDRSTEAR